MTCTVLVDGAGAVCDHRQYVLVQNPPLCTPVAAAAAVTNAVVSLHRGWLPARRAVDTDGVKRLGVRCERMLGVDRPGAATWLPCA